MLIEVTAREIERRRGRGERMLVFCWERRNVLLPLAREYLEEIACGQVIYGVWLDRYTSGWELMRAQGRLTAPCLLVFEGQRSSGALAGLSQLIELGPQFLSRAGRYANQAD